MGSALPKFGELNEMNGKVSGSYLGKQVEAFGGVKTSRKLIQIDWKAIQETNDFLDDFVK